VLHIMLFRTWSVFGTFTLVPFEVCIQRLVWLIFVVTWFRAFLVSFSGIVWLILRWLHLPLFLMVTSALTLHMHSISFIRSSNFRICSQFFFLLLLLLLLYFRSFPSNLKTIYIYRKIPFFPNITNNPFYPHKNY
jgi:hypothetical protein